MIVSASQKTLSGLISKHKHYERTSGVLLLIAYLFYAQRYWFLNASELASGIFGVSRHILLRITRNILKCRLGPYHCLDLLFSDSVFIRLFTSVMQCLCFQNAICTVTR